MPCDDCLSRREFLTRSTLAVAGAAAIAAGCGDGDFGPTGVTPDVTGAEVKVSTIPGLATTGQLVMLQPASSLIAVKRTGPSSFVAMSMVCTHQQCATALANNSFECPCHGARYDADGNVTRQPQASGSATPLFRYRTSYDASSDILTISTD